MSQLEIYKNMDQQLKLAEIMCTGKVMIPEHLRGSQGDCLAVIMQAAQWELNPFVVAQKTFLIKGKLGYEAQLVIAIINAKAPIKDRVNFEYKGSGQRELILSDKELLVAKMKEFLTPPVMPEVDADASLFDGE